MSGGPPDPSAIGGKPKGQTTASTIFERVETLETRKYFEEGMKKLDEAFSLFEKAGLKFLKEHSVNGSTLKLIEEKIVEADKWAIRFTVETSNVYDAAMGLILNGLAVDLSRIADGLKSLTIFKSEFVSPVFDQLFSEATTMAAVAYNNFRTVNLNGAKKVESRYEEFRKKWGIAFRETLQKDLLIAIEKIAVNGLYISRLLTKPLPKDFQV
jgi:hypothetical protein